MPEQVWYMHPLASMMLAGILPFGAVFIELFFILNVCWVLGYRNVLRVRLCGCNTQTDWLL